MGATAARTLAQYAAGLRFEHLPDAVVGRARDCVIDTLGVALQGARLPWGRMVAGYARRYGGGGTSRILGEPGGVAAPLAALANGVFAHGFEQDSLRKPGAGVHPGAALVPPALALAEELGASGKALLAAVVAGAEVMFRIGVASRHTSEHKGFHAPGLTGPFGAAVTAGHLLGLDGERMTQALGIAGSLCGGLLAFAHAGNGAMVKRLHLGRAAEAGVLAARLAAEGYKGPDTILEGAGGFLDVYCEDTDPDALVAGLGERFELLNLCFKRWPCHVTAHAPLQAIAMLRAATPFAAADVVSIELCGSAKLLSHHSGRDPADTMAAQYSVPWCVAVAIAGDPMDPAMYLDAALRDEALRRLCRGIVVAPWPADGVKRGNWASRVAIGLRDGRRLVQDVDDFKGTPTSPLSAAELRAKFIRCAGDTPRAAALAEALEALVDCADVRALPLG